MKQKYQKFSDLEYWNQIGFLQARLNLVWYTGEIKIKKEYRHKIRAFHEIYENPFGFIDVRQFKRTLNNVNYYEKKLRA